MSNPRRPSLAWRAFVIAGVGTSVAVTVSDDAWEKWKGVAGETIPRDVMKSFVVGTGAVHVSESLWSFRAARRAKLDHPGRWALSTLLWGFPVMRRLRAQRKALAAG
jgi:hypothetical protein